jgi:hypothetical protein
VLRLTGGDWAVRLICVVAVFLLVLSLVAGAYGLAGADGMSSDVIITSFYSCDTWSVAQYSFPRNSTAYFNVTVTNYSNVTKNISIHVSAEDLIDQSIGFKQIDTTIPDETSASYLMDIFVPTYAVIGVAEAHASIWSGGLPIYTAEDIEFYVGPADSIVPSMRILSPENKTYNSSLSLPLTFTIDERVTWMAYSINSTANVTLTGNMTLTGLTNNAYLLTVYARDTSGNVGASPAVLFTIYVQHDVGVYNLTSSTEVTYIGDVVNTTVTVRNQGTMPETFNLTIRANDITLTIFNLIDFAPFSNTTIFYHWNTTGFIQSNYSLSAYASPVSEETHLYDNYCFGPGVYLMTMPDIAVESGQLSRTIVGQDRFVSIEMRLRNKNAFVGSLNISIYADSVLILTILENLTGSENVTTAFVWYPINMSRDIYLITCLAAPLVFEANISDNLLELGHVTVTITGDLTGQYGIPDWKVDMRDISALVMSFGKAPPAPGWDPNKDLNDDLRIDIRDIAVACRNFLKS